MEGGYYYGSGQYGICLFDDLHRYLPALLYEPERFLNVQDVLRYMQAQAAYHCNHYNRSLNSYRGRRRGRGRGGGYSYQSVRSPQQWPSPPAPPPVQQTMAPASVPPQAAQTSDDAILTMLTNMLNTTTPISTRILSTELFDLTPVTVRPTRQQLDRGSELERPGVEFTVSDSDTCAICQDRLRLPESSPLRRLRHCSHTFHRTCIDTWFTSHVHCPICRHDIRETT